MATFNHISGQEPSTVSFKLATVTQTRNSSVMHQEILAIGDPDTSNAIAAVLNGVPPSTAWGIVTRQVGNSSIQGNSTVFQGTSPWVIAGNSTVAPLAGSTWATRPIQSSAADLQMTATQGTSPWVVAGASTVAPLAGSTWATRPIQSSAADLQMTATPVAGSTWRTQPGSTLWASSAGFHFNSSGDLKVEASVSATVGSTVSTGFISVRISDGSTWVVDYLNASTFTSTNVGGGVNFLRAGQSSVSSTDLFVIPWGSTQGAQYIIPVTDSGVSVIDSTNRAINVNVVAGAAGGSTIMTVSTVQGAVIVRSSAANALVSVYQSTASELQATVTPVAGSTWRSQPGSTLWASSAGFHFDSSGAMLVAGSFSAQFSSTKADNLVTVYQSTAADLNVTVAGYSTIVAVSSLGGAVITRSSKADSLHTVYQSTASDLNVTVAGYSTTVNVSSLGGVVTIQGNSTVSIGTNLQSSVAPSSGSSGLVVRQVVDVITSFASTSALASTTLSVVSSVANIRAYVTAYSITSTNQTPAHWGFFSSNGTQLWALTLAALSSGVAGANLAVSPPGYLFRTAASDALNFKTAGSTVAGVQLSVSYFQAP